MILPNLSLLDRLAIWVLHHSPRVSLLMVKDKFWPDVFLLPIKLIRLRALCLSAAWSRSKIHSAWCLSVFITSQRTAKTNDLLTRWPPAFNLRAVEPDVARAHHNRAKA